jgi:rod shape determining protein RodA
MKAPGLNENRQHGIDWTMLAAVLCLMLIGVAFVFSASFADPNLREASLFKQLYVKQTIWYVLGLGVATAVCFFEYHSLARWSLIGYWGSILLLVSVMFIGVERLGARRWIDFGPFSLQPSEFAKLAFILMMANYLSRPLDELRQPRIFLKALGMIALPFVLILKEPDLGSALSFFPVGLVMMFVAGVPLKFLLRLVGGISALVILLLVDILFAPPGWQIKLEEYQRHRLLTYFGRDFAPANATPEERRRARELQRSKSYNVEQALISVGSGGLTGKGWREGTQYALGFLPRAVAHNDFIFSVIAEEKGFVGSVVVVTLYTVVLFCGIRTAGQARDRLGRVMASGVVTLLFVHVFINIGMNIRLMPVTGIPLPLLSYGGSSVICSLLAVGLLQNIYYYRRHY